MKVFCIWLALAATVYGGMSAGYHLYLTDNPGKILVALDTSYPMKTDWHKVPALLKSIQNRRYTQFALVTEKNRVHGWASALNAAKLTPYAPRDLSKLENTNSFPEKKEADRAIFITNASQAETENLNGWEIMSVLPDS